MKLRSSARWDLTDEEISIGICSGMRNYMVVFSHWGEFFEEIGVVE